MKATVVIATRDRTALLCGCLDALSLQVEHPEFSIVVVDDRSEPPLQQQLGTTPRGATIVRAEGHGPARARNAGIASADGDVVLFTDDDTVPCPGWVGAACRFLELHPSHVGVEGPVTTEPFDRLTEYSVADSVPGAYYTCNVAYRRETLVRLGGFSVDYPHPHCEDLDLGFRAPTLGPIGYSEEMTVWHRPRRVSLASLARRGRLVDSELMLRRRFPDRYPSTAPVPQWVEPIVNIARAFRHDVHAEGRRLASPRRAARFTALYAARLYYASATLVRLRLRGAHR